MDRAVHVAASGAQHVLEPSLRDPALPQTVQLLVTGPAMLRPIHEDGEGLRQTPQRRRAPLPLQPLLSHSGLRDPGRPVCPTRFRSPQPPDASLLCS